jgi:two-component system, OmpR family, alkaline phosphatase synthesis response regulator PhoP
MQVAPRSSVRPAHLLIAEDEPHIRRILITIMESSGFEVDVALDGREALERLSSETPYDLVLMDLLMPYLTGLDVLAQARKMPHRKDLPVVILTAKGQDADRERAISLGAADFVTKPFSPKKLLKRVDQLLASG